MGAFADVDVFVDEILKELAAMARDGVRPQRSGPKPPLAGAALRKAVMAICYWLRVFGWVAFTCKDLILLALVHF
jgi:hypothetical protein